MNICLQKKEEKFYINQIFHKNYALRVEKGFLSQAARKHGERIRYS